VKINALQPSDSRGIREDISGFPVHNTPLNIIKEQHRKLYTIDGKKGSVANWETGWFKAVR
jgi:hypothetical protein